MKLHLFSSGTIIAWKHLLVRGAPKEVRITVPVPFYLIEHNNEFVLFDTGQQVPEKPVSNDSNFIPQVTSEERAVVQLKKYGVEPERIKCIILSHHHADHSRGLTDFPGVPCVLRKEELEYPFMKRLIEQDSEREWIHPEGCLDLFGDGCVISLPTPGHTLGHQSLLLVSDDSRRILLAADAAYTEIALNQTPPQEEKDDLYWQTIGMFRKFRNDGVQIITGHDPETWDSLQKQYP